MPPSIWRRLLIQAFCCEVVRARTKLGIAMAARRPMMATTIMISTKVKPEFFEVLIFILFYLVVCFYGVSEAIGRFIISAVSLTFCLLLPHLVISRSGATRCIMSG